MSIVLQSSGGGQITLQEPTTASNFTQTLPAATGTVALTNAPVFTGQATIPTINLTGGQITFPATQSASSDANTLDDYEEGTWTPTQGSGLTVVGTFSSEGTYIKIGKLITLTGSVAGSTSISCAVTNVLTRIPFTSEGGLKAGLGGVTNNALNQSNTCWLNPSDNALFCIEAVSATPRIWFSITFVVA